MVGETKPAWAAVQQLFDDLVDLPPAEQTRHLSGAPAQLARQVAALLAASADPGILDMKPPVLGDADAGAGYSSLSPGDPIGGFVIDRLIGRGGMGEVYLAHRAAADFEQRVALKMLRAEAAARGDMFARERRLLARLEHRGIARLIDGGIAPDGRAYMAMDYVDGAPISTWCNDHGADLSRRLALFREVCEAVSYAHANLVVHRDLTPSNILIDHNGNVRLLDFGIAKLLDETSIMPATTQAMLTPDYAAPEQLDGDDATVATDIYALGVILYELVAGRGPWQREGSSIPAIIRRVLHDDPPLPSKAAARPGAPVPAARIAGDLDAIILKAMRREPADRYRSVTELADDVRRHQELKPVHARGGSTRYMLGRFVRRYRWAVGASVATLAAILIGTAGVAWQARKTAIERDLALGEARRSEAIVRMLTVMFRDTADTDKGSEATVKQMLDQTATRLVDSLDTSPKSATLITTLSDLYVNLEDDAGADSLLQRALAKGIGKGDPVATAQIKVRLASSAASLNRTEDMASLLDAAEAVFGRDPERFRSERLDIASVRAQLARRNGDYDTAIRLLSTNLPLAERVYAENHRDLLTLYNNLLVYMVEANQLDAMPAVFAQADAVLKRTGQEGSTTGLAIASLKGGRLLKIGQTTQAEAIFRQVAARRRAVFGESAGLAVDLLQLGRTELALGKFAEARRTLEQARPIAIDNLGPRAVMSLLIEAGLIEAMAETGDTASAEHLMAEVSPLFAAITKVGLPHGILARARAITFLKLGRLNEARVEVDRGEAILRSLGPAGESYLKSFQTLRQRIARAG
ncbi:MAG: serine/threonine-protein kinase [Sphingomonas sp.]|jgi:non-specific serine/threonine protein kinase/serine/threonine-protein kinase|uniref:serine/threonine-protein kinase n=1 Tax=Sphingomonas sp. TaxID=28214 RepID=UPI00356762F3